MQDFFESLVVWIVFDLLGGLVHIFLVHAQGDGAEQEADGQELGVHSCGDELLCFGQERVSVDVDPGAPHGRSPQAGDDQVFFGREGFHHLLCGGQRFPTTVFGEDTFLRGFRGVHVVVELVGAQFGVHGRGERWGDDEDGRSDRPWQFEDPRVVFWGQAEDTYRHHRTEGQAFEATHQCCS